MSVIDSTRPRSRRSGPSPSPPAAAATTTTAAPEEAPHGGHDPVDGQRRRQHLDRRHLDRRRAEVLPGRDRRVHQDAPEGQGQVQPRGRQRADGRSAPRWRAATRRTSQRSDSRRGQAVPGEGRAQAAGLRQARRSTKNYPADFIKLGTINGKLYSFVFKGANKSTVWYNVDAFKNAGVNPPANWGDFLNDAKTLKASGVPAYSIGGGDGWTLTDLFENIYLRQAGADKYDQLVDARDQVDRPVGQGHAARRWRRCSSDKSNIAGGTSGALETDFPTSVSNVFTTSPKAAQVIEGDFVPGVVASKTKLKPKTGYDVYPFPAIGSSADAVVGGGDSIAMFKDTPAGAGVRQVPGQPGGGADLGPARRLLVAEQGRRGRACTRTTSRARRRRRSPRRRRSGSTCPTWRRRRSAARRVRASGRSSRTSSTSPTTSTAPRQARGLGGQGLQEQVGHGRRRQRPVSERARPLPNPPAPDAGDSTPSRRCSSAPALVFLAVWIVYPTIRTVIRSFFDRSGDNFVWFDNYKTLFTSDTLVKAIENNAIWLAVVPASWRRSASSSPS